MASEPLTDSLRETLALFDGSGAPRTTTEAADLLDLGRRSTYDRLKRLVEHGRLETKKVGANARVWWRPPSTSIPATPDRTATAESLVDDVLDDVEASIFVLDENCDVVWINATTERYFGLDREQALGRDSRQLVDERIAPAVDDSEAFAETVLTAYDDDTYVERECRVIPDDQREERWLEHHSKPIESGAYAGGQVDLYYEITDRKRSKRDHRDDHGRFESLVEAVEEYAIFTLDTDGYVRTWNPGAERIKGYEVDDIVGEHLSVFYTDDDRAAGVPDRNLSEATNRGSVEDEGWRVRDDGSRFWANVTITAIRDADGELEGYAKVTRDMTKRHEYEENLRRQRDVTRRILQTAPVGVLVLEEDGSFETANQRANELLGVDDETTLTVGVNDVYDENGELLQPHERPYVRVFETGEAVRNVHLAVPDSEGGRRWLSTNVEPLSVHDGDVEQALVTIEDVSQLKEQTRRLERQRDEVAREFEEVLARIDDAFYAVDDEFRFTYVNERAEKLLRHTEAELLGESVWDVFPEATETPAWKSFHAALESQEPTSYEIYFDPLEFWVEANVYPSESGLSVYFRDVTGRKEREQELKTRIRQQEVVTDLGYRALGDCNLDVLMAAASELVSDALGTDYCEVLDLDADAEELLLRHGVGWDEDIVGEATVSSVKADSQTAHTLANERPIVVEDLETEAQFGGPDLLTSHDVKSGISVTIGRNDDPWGILGTHDTERTEFSQQDVNFVQSVANILATAIDRQRNEQELVRQREELATLNDLNSIVRDITEAVIAKSTREEIEQAVCDALAASETYEFAWLAAVDSTTDIIEPRVTAGTEGYAEEITVSMDPDDPSSTGPAATAIREQDTQVVEDVFSNPDFEPWREVAAEYGVTAVASIPIVHSGTVYGVLGVYADRPNAFDVPEREVISQLGEVIGHAIAAVERKRALMSDEIVEIEFRLADVFDALDVDAPTEGTISIDESVPIGGGEYLVYGTATPAAVESVSAIVEAVSHWTDVTFRDGTDETEFELRLSDPPVLSMIASLGGSIEEAVIEDGDYRMTFHLSPNTDTSHIIDAVQAAYPPAELVARRQIERSDEPLERVTQVLDDALTDRQHTVLTAAYHAGFFEWPRDVSGEGVAESLDIAPPTFSQHLRKAEKKVFDVLLSTST